MTERKLVDDFYNKVITEIKDKYFQEVNILAIDKFWEVPLYKRYSKVKYQIELYSNGCLKYIKFIDNLTKLCKADKVDIESIITKYIND